MKLKIRTAVLMVASIILLAIGGVSAQNINKDKTDKIFFVNGTAKEGKVVGIGTEKIEFTHEGETLKYEFAKKDIERIEFASGRTEMVTEKKVEINAPADTRNKVAILPVEYMADENNSLVEDMRYYLQEILIADYSKAAAELKFQDAAEINAKLLKKGINKDNIRQYLPKEIASLLEVEYVITGSVLQDRGAIHANTTDFSSRKESTDQKSNKTEQKTIRNSSANARQNYETHVSLSIYSQNGDKIYTKSRQSILSDKDAYKNALHYLLKRTPLYKR